MEGIFLSNKTFSLETKISALKYLEEGRYSAREICKMFNLNPNRLYEWRAKYQFGGTDALLRPVKNKRYPKELKKNAVEDYLTGNYSKYEIMIKYGISGRKVFNSWLKKYNSHSELKDSNQRMSQTMTKGRKTTFEERIEIVKACLTNEKDYKTTAVQYDVTYQQVYQWVRKFEDGGEASLEDRRGRMKSADELTPEDKLRLKIQQIERENERLRAENLLLKKLEEIERRLR